MAVVPATFIDYNTVLCNISANLYTTSGDARLGVMYDSRGGPYATAQEGPSFTFYDPGLGASVVNFSKHEKCGLL